MSWRIGIDLGGTKVEGLLLDESGTERWRERLPTPQGDYDGTIDAIKTLVTRASEHAQANAGECLVGIGHPGSVSPSTGLHRNANSTCLNGRDSENRSRSGTWSRRLDGERRQLSRLE